MVYDPKRIHQVETFGWDDGSEFLCITLVKLDLMIKSEDLGSLACQRERLIRQINCRYRSTRSGEIDRIRSDSTTNLENLLALPFVELSK